RHHGFNRGFIHFSNLGNGYNALDPGYRFIEAFLLRREHTYFALIADFLDVDCCTGFALNFLDDLSTWSYDSTDKLFINEYLNHSWCMWLNVRTGCFDTGVHGIQNVLPALMCLHQCFPHGVHAETVNLNIHLHAA